MRPQKWCCDTAPPPHPRLDHRCVLSMCRDLLGQVAVRERLRADPLLQLACSRFVATDALVPGKRGREEQPLTTAVVRVTAVAVDTTSGADEVEIDLANCLDHARIIRWHDAERYREPCEAPINAVVVGTSAEATVGGVGLEEPCRDAHRRVGERRVVEEVRRRAKSRGDRSKCRGVLSVVELLPTTEALKPPAVSEVLSDQCHGRGQLRVGAGAAEVMLECPQPHAVAVDLEVRPRLVAVPFTIALECVARGRRLLGRDRLAMHALLDCARDQTSVRRDGRCCPAMERRCGVMLADDVERIGAKGAIAQPRVAILGEGRASDERTRRGLAGRQDVDAATRERAVRRRCQAARERHPLIAPAARPLTNWRWKATKTATTGTTAMTDAAKTSPQLVACCP